MAQIEHHGHPRRTDIYWLFPNNEEDKKRFKYQILYVATCPVCDQMILEQQPVFLDWTRGRQERIKYKEHDKWIARTDPVTGDLGDVDTSQWASKKAGVHRVKSSLKQFPYTQYLARV